VWLDVRFDTGTKAHGHALEHRTLGTVQFAPALNTLGEIRKIPVEQLLAMSGGMVSMPASGVKIAAQKWERSGNVPTVDLTAKTGRRIRF